ncbi:MAG: hypothetical protein JWM11_5888 [Planctomycetaceae bacterium]|nr:hypothetical protein [Planctomycetaceae bacterium]
MTLTDQLLQILSGMAGFSAPLPQTVSVTEPADVTLELDVSSVDRLSCSFRELRLSVEAFRRTEAASLKKWADDICRRVTYLMEQLGALELDPTTGTVQVRSMPPDRQNDQTRYYEIFLKTPGQLTLRRYRAVSGAGREQIDLQTTHELLQRLIPDLVQTSQRV